MPDARVTRRYRDDTLILETRFETAGRRGHRHRLHAAARRATPTSSASCAASAAGCAMRTELVLRFDYGRTVPWVTPPRRRHAARDRRARTWWCCTRRSQLRGEDLHDGRRVRRSPPARRVPFVLTHGPSHLPPPDADRSRARARRRPRRSGASGPRAADVDGEWARRGDALADHAEGADLRADRRHRRGADDVAARAARRHRATGTTATAGCATRR